MTSFTPILNEELEHNGGAKFSEMKVQKRVLYTS